MFRDDGGFLVRDKVYQLFILPQIIDVRKHFLPRLEQSLVSAHTNATLHCQSGPAPLRLLSLSLSDGSLIDGTGLRFDRATPDHLFFSVLHFLLGQK